MEDTLRVLPKACPFLVWDDPVQLCWNDEERKALMDMDPSFQRLTKPLSAGVHLRPYGDRHMLLLWDFMHSHQTVSDPPSESIAFIDVYPEIVLRGLSNALPNLEVRKGVSLAGKRARNL